MRAATLAGARAGHDPRVIWAAALGLISLILGVAALALGPVALSPDRVLAALVGQANPMETAIVLQIRLPRLLLGLAVGSAIALSGASLQGLLRNPLADPSLIGVTAGATVGAVIAIVLGDWLLAGLPSQARPFALPIAAFIGAALVMSFVFALARRQGQTSVATLILAGIAVNAIAGAAIGALIYVSDDQQLRDLTFWTMGGLSITGWPMVIVACLCAAAMAPVFLCHRRALDQIQLGERAAYHAGLDVEQTKRRLAFATALSVGAVTAAAGPIGFIGLVAPHLARLAFGPAHGRMLPAAALIGVALTLAADLAVRLVAPPAEPPIGLATSLIGGPFFLWLMLRRGGRSHA